jgi:hypothetical protein
VKLTLLEILGREDDYEWALTGTGTARITFRNADDPNVRAQLSLDARLGDVPYLDIARAFVRMGFPWFRATVGKAALSWGEGFYYNAGDVIFGPVGSSLDITADELRDEAAWLTTIFVSLGPFSFLEAVAVSPELNISELLSDPKADPPSAADTAGGLRVLTKIGATQAEAGYLFRGTEVSHNPYLSLQGNLYVDWYLSGTTSIPQWNPRREDLTDTLLVSGGLYHIARLPGRSDLQLRLEGLVAPDAAWTDREDPEATYGLMLYPEIVWNAGESVAVILRNFVSPIDRSALLSAGVNWNVFEGLKLLAFVAGQVGGDDDIYGWDRPGGIAVTTGVQYIY